MLSNPQDCERIARHHIKKQPNFSTQFFESVISTTDDAHWKKQRAHLVEAFLPASSLKQIFPISLSRAERCAARLRKIASESPGGVQMHDFFLHEAQAQLQLGLFGMDEEYMESTNEPLRNAFAGINPDPDFLKNCALEMMDKCAADPDFATAMDVMEGRSGSKGVFGPLSQAVATSGEDFRTMYGNMMIILFAGHDTTGHTMTWLTYELARRPDYQKRLQAEVDELFDDLEKEGRSMSYPDDMVRMPFLTRCIMETLRKWVIVPNGTFRQLAYDEYVAAPTDVGDERSVLVPKGTFVQVQAWTRHRNPKLWGDDVNEFNPDRKFEGTELWDNQPFAAYNPATPRFSPFSFQPRDCLGKNFAQMEMRTILPQMFRHFDFTLTKEYANLSPARESADSTTVLRSSNTDPLPTNIDVYGGTMGPRDLSPEAIANAEDRLAAGSRPKLGMWLHATPRTPPPTRTRTQSRL